MILQRDFYLQSPMDAAVALVGRGCVGKCRTANLFARVYANWNYTWTMIVRVTRLVVGAARVMMQCLWRVAMHTYIYAMDCIIC